MKNKKGSRGTRNKVAARRGAEASSGVGVEGTRLSMLPDDILVNILERVQTLDALRTCILSKRMLRLSTMLSRFDIRVGGIVSRHKGRARYDNRIARYNDALANVTEKVLYARNREIPISKLRVRFFLRRYECLTISKAVARTMATQKVNDAEFVITTEKGFARCIDADLLWYAKLLKTCLGDCPAAFAGLTRLWLRNMRFDEEPDIPNILNTCKRLESLRLTCCDAGVRSVLQVEHPQLVELAIDSGKFETVVLNCLPKLQHLSYTNWSYQDPLCFESVPQLSKLSLAKMGIRSTKNLEFSQFLADVPSITDLHLDFQSEKIWVLPEHPTLLAPVLGKLQIANLVNLPEGCDIAWTMFILEAAPSLKELHLSVWDHWCNIVTDENFRREHGYCEKANVQWQPCSFDFKHKNLVQLTIYGFQPEINFVQYVRRVMEVAVNLREICLHDREVCEDCGDLDPKIKNKVCPSRYPRTCAEKDMLREEITRELGMASTAVIHFRS